MVTRMRMGWRVQERRVVWQSSVWMSGEGKFSSQGEKQIGPGV